MGALMMSTYFVLMMLGLLNGLTNPLSELPFTQLIYKLLANGQYAHLSLNIPLQYNPWFLSIKHIGKISEFLCSVVHETPSSPGLVLNQSCSTFSVPLKSIGLDGPTSMASLQVSLTLIELGILVL